ncbi:nucleolar protein 3 [Alligator mississippiensis]|uniref:Nucleolar protein 3-like n=1 Tax=Alligator mississippiensis TaxID=8496 RepID=A0A151MTE3_ALLMI|nr:nucleolar protein 3 [Alligator mississippiensis]XP_059587556.1 nucleolar protein 3 [Alligator mississippiensis]XP_059587557.1 nucleolar protein 3 [Alligator mississippiensis]XP_059587558.1 nucleolar protein 3 [Alligator mississippiensis]KYO27777.1 nucleolar protein 3-like [Alligator mississippiensis]
MAAGSSYAAVRDHRQELVDIIGRDPENTLDELVAQSLLSEDEYDALNQTPGAGPKVRKLLICIQKKGEAACRALLEQVDALFPGSVQALLHPPLPRPSLYDFYNPERDAQPSRFSERQERDCVHPEPAAGAGEQEEETPRDKEGEEDNEGDPQEEGEGAEGEADTAPDPEEEEGGSPEEPEPEPEPEPEETYSDTD